MHKSKKIFVEHSYAKVFPRGRLGVGNYSGRVARSPLVASMASPISLPVTDWQGDQSHQSNTDWPTEENLQKLSKIMLFFSRPGRSQGLLYKPPCEIN